MPTAATVVPLTPNSSDQCAIISWTLAAGETGDAVEHANLSDRTVEFGGTFGTATVEMRGSVAGTTYGTLTEPQGNPLSKTAYAIEAIAEVTRYIRPVVTGGNGTTAIVVSLIAKGSRG